MLESLDQCATSQPGTMKLEVVECIKRICDCLENWCEGRHFPAHLVQQVNKLYPSLENSDYLGERTFSSSLSEHLLMNLVMFRSSYVHE